MVFSLINLIKFDQNHEVDLVTHDRLTLEASAESLERIRRLGDIWHQVWLIEISNRSIRVTHPSKSIWSLDKHHQKSNTQMFAQMLRRFMGTVLKLEKMMNFSADFGHYWQTNRADISANYGSLVLWAVYLALPTSNCRWHRNLV